MQLVGVCVLIVRGGDRQKRSVVHSQKRHTHGIEDAGVHESVAKNTQVDELMHHRMHEVVFTLLLLESQDQP